MKRIPIIMFIGLFSLFFSCINSTPLSAPVIFQDLPAGEFAGKIKNMDKDKYTILDVRTQEEYNQIHLVNAINLDFYAVDFKTQIDALDKTKTYFLYCRTGNRSGKTLALMKELGFREVYNLAGGIFKDTEELPVAE